MKPVILNYFHTQPEQKRALIPPPYRTLEAVRGIAALWVVFFHATLLMSLTHPSTKSLPGYFILNVGYLGVQVFFVVSGYCIASAACSALGKPTPVRGFAIARLRRIFPPMWASIALIALASLTATWLVAHNGFEHTSLADIDLPHRSLAFYLTNLTLTQLVYAFPHRAIADGLFHSAFLSDVCWTLCYEMAFYLIVGIVLAALLLLRPKRPADSTIRLMFNLLHILTAICCILLITSPTILPYPFDLWPQFGLGVAVFDIVRHRRSPIAWSACLTISLLFLAFLFLQSLPIGQTQQPSRLTFSAALIAAILLLACHSLDSRLIALAPIRLAAFIGTFSYSLYLINFFLVAGLLMLYKHLHLASWTALPAIFLIVLLILPFAYLFFRLFEQPFMKSRAKRDKLLPYDIPSSPPINETTPVTTGGSNAGILPAFGAQPRQNAACRNEPAKHL